MLFLPHRDTPLRLSADDVWCNVKESGRGCFVQQPMHLDHLCHFIIKIKEMNPNAKPFQFNPSAVTWAPPVSASVSSIDSAVKSEILPPSPPDVIANQATRSEGYPLFACLIICLLACLFTLTCSLAFLFVCFLIFFIDYNRCNN